MKFTLIHLILVVVIIALICGWVAERRVMSARISELQNAQVRNAYLKDQLSELRQEFSRLQAFSWHGRSITNGTDAASQTVKSNG